MDGLTDLEIAEKMATGDISDIVPRENYFLIPMRITGTGITERTFTNSKGIRKRYQINREPERFLTDEFVKMCNGLPVSFVHPEGGKLTYDNYLDHVVGSIFLPFVKGNEVWGVAKIFDRDILNFIDEGYTSTSPSVDSNNTMDKDGVIYELPTDINHIAFVREGHWDNDQPALATDILNPTQGENPMDVKNDACKVDNAEVVEPMVNKELEVKKDDETKPEASTNEKQGMETKDLEKKVDEPTEASTNEKQGMETKGADDRIGRLETVIGTLSEAVQFLMEIEKKEPEHKEEMDATDIDEEIIDEADEADKEEIVNTVTEIADSRHNDVVFKKPTPRLNEKASSYMGRVLSLNADKLDDKYKFLVGKVDSASMDLAKDALNAMKDKIANESRLLAKKSTSCGVIKNADGSKSFPLGGF